MRLVLLGLPGAGKGTQAKRIAEEYHLTAISTGEMLREATKEKDTFGLRVQEYMNKGELVPDEWINSLVKSRLQAKDVENGFVLDGYPRTLQQAKMLEAYLQSQNQNLDAVFFLDVSQDTLRHRLAQRGNLRSKEKQGNSQIESKREKIRLDDKPEVIENRGSVASFELYVFWYNGWLFFKCYLAGCFFLLPLIIDEIHFFIEKNILLKRYIV